MTKEQIEQQFEDAKKLLLNEYKSKRHLLEEYKVRLQGLKDKFEPLIANTSDNSIFNGDMQKLFELLTIISEKDYSSPNVDNELQKKYDTLVADNTNLKAELSVVKSQLDLIKKAFS